MERFTLTNIARHMIEKFDYSTTEIDAIFYSILKYHSSFEDLFYSLNLDTPGDDTIIHLEQQLNNYGFTLIKKVV